MPIIFKDKEGNIVKEGSTIKPKVDQIKEPIKPEKEVSLTAESAKKTQSKKGDQ